MASKPRRREYGSGGVSWLEGSKARLRIRMADGRQRTKLFACPTTRTTAAEARPQEELRLFAEELEAAERPAATGHTLKQLMAAYIAHCQRVGRKQSTIEHPEDTPEVPFPHLHARQYGCKRHYLTGRVLVEDLLTLAVECGATPNNPGKWRRIVNRNRQNFALGATWGTSHPGL